MEEEDNSPEAGNHIFCITKAIAARVELSEKNVGGHIIEAAYY